MSLDRAIAKRAQWSCHDQKREFDLAYNKKLRYNDKWEPIPKEWVDLWNKYIEFGTKAEFNDASDASELEALWPGPIDSRPLSLSSQRNNMAQMQSNASMQPQEDSEVIDLLSAISATDASTRSDNVDSYHHEMRKDLEENADYILLPRSFTDKLFAYYGGNADVRLCRTVVKLESGKTAVKLYPPRFEIHLCGPREVLIRACNSDNRSSNICKNSNGININNSEANVCGDRSEGASVENKSNFVDMADGVNGSSNIIEEYLQGGRSSLYCPHYITINDAIKILSVDFSMFPSSWKKVRFWIRIKDDENGDHINNNCDSISGTSPETSLTDSASSTVDGNDLDNSNNKSNSGNRDNNDSNNGKKSVEISNNKDVQIELSEPSMRLITIDKVGMITSRSGARWKLHHSKFPDLPVEQFISAEGCIEIIIEGCDQASPSWGAWPLSALLAGWLDDIREGDVVDARKSASKVEAPVSLTSYNENSIDSSLTSSHAPLQSSSTESIGSSNPLTESKVANCAWKEAIITKVSEDRKSFTLHYKSYHKSEDEIVKISDLSEKIAPLYTYTENWRSSIKEESELDVRVFPEIDDIFKEGDYLWLQGVVKEVKGESNEVLVTYNEGAVDNERNIRIREKGAPRSSAFSWFSFFSFDSDAETSITNLRYVKKWISVQSEDIAKLHTHTIKEVNNNSLTNKANKTSSSAMWGGDSGYFDRSRRGFPKARGLVGLQNIGNTCYMNSMIQCLSHVEPLNEIFLKGLYLAQKNGNGDGAVVRAYGQLIKDIHSNSFLSITPHKFKSAIGARWAQFSRWDQQDSHELMQCLIDGIHEDLNRITKKPYVHLITSHGRPDELISRESLRRHLLRHDSAISDIMAGQSKSRITCKVCQQQSISFEPYFCLSLPIPQNFEKVIKILVRMPSYSLDPFEISIVFDERKTVSSLLEAALRHIESLHLSDKCKSRASFSNSIFTEASDSHIKFNPQDNTDKSSNRDAMPSESRGLSASSATSADYMHSDGGRKGVTSIYNWRMFTSSLNYINIEMPKNEDKVIISSYSRYYLVQLEKLANASNDSKSISTGCTSSAATSNSATNCSTDSTNRTTAPKEAEVSVDAANCLMFACTRRKAYYGGSVYLDAIELPVGISYTKSKTSNMDIYHKALEYSSRFINVDCKIIAEPSTLNFELFSTNQRCPMAKNLIPWDDAPFEIESGDGIALIFLDTITEIVKPTTSYPLFGADPSSTTITKRATLLRCLDKYIEEEALEESETYYCSKCKNNLAPMKKMDLWTSPDVLAIHLKRFYYCQGTYGVFRQKISDFVDFPLNGLDLTPYIRGPISDSAPPIYDLCSVSYHSGTLGGGHYTAGCRNLENGLWYYFNDDSVSPLEPANVVSDLAYVLIYKRRKGSLVWGGVTPTEASEALQDDPPNS